VQQAGTEKKLRPGEQVSTNPTMPTVPVIEELSWSQDAAAHAALLQQAAAMLPPVLTTSPPLPAQNLTEAHEAFEVVSIRPSAPLPQGGRGGATASGGINIRTCTGPFSFQLDPGRLVMTRTSLFILISLAYGKNCPTTGTIAGGPEWIRSDRYDIQAT